jgi:hypothetical protein
MLAGLAYNTVRVPAYSASSELLISNTTLALSGPEAVVTQVLLENSLIESAIEILKSGRVLERVIDKLGLEEIERMSPRKYALAWTSHSEPDSADARRQAVIALLRSNTTVTRVGPSQIVSVRARAVTAIDAARLTNEIAGADQGPRSDRPNHKRRRSARFKGTTDGWTRYVARDRAGRHLGAGSGVAMLLLDRRLRAAEQLTAMTSVECFGYVPRIDPQSSLPSEPDYIESMLRRSVLRRIRSAVLERSTRLSHIVGVTSCSAGEGKTTLAANLARFHCA